MRTIQKPVEIKYEIICYNCNEARWYSEYKYMRNFQIEHYKSCGKHPIPVFL